MDLGHSNRFNGKSTDGESMKSSIRLKLVLAFALLTTPFVAFAAPKTFKDLSDFIVSLLDTATLLLILFGLVAYFWGIMTNIPHFGDEKGAEKRKSYFFWGVIIFFVMVSIWGILRILSNTLFGS